MHYIFNRILKAFLHTPITFDLIPAANKKYIRENTLKLLEHKSQLVRNLGF